MLCNPEHYSADVFVAFFMADLLFLWCDGAMSGRQDITDCVRTYCCGLEDLHFGFEWLVVSFDVFVSGLHTMYVRYRCTSLSTSKSDLKYASKSDRSPQPPDCVLFQRRIQMFL